MGWSWKIGRLFGVDIFAHVSFLAIIAINLLGRSLDGTQVVIIITQVILLFAIITAHEFGHILVARYYGIETKKITLSALGGMAMMESMPRDPKQEFLISIAGPLVNGALALALCLVFLLTGNWDAITLEKGALVYSWQSLPTHMFWINVVVGVFNLLPAIPMDGGRMLRSALTFPIGRYQATKISTMVAYFLASILFFLSFKGFGPMFLILPFFIFISAHAERQFLEVEYVTRTGLGRAIDHPQSCITPNLGYEVVSTLEPDDLCVVVDGQLYGKTKKVDKAFKYCDKAEKIYGQQPLIIPAFIFFLTPQST